MTSSRRQAALPCLALGAASLAILCAAPAQYLGRQQDDLLYIISSHALASGGYRLFTSPANPPLVMITPGFPALLLPVTWLAGEWYAAYQLLCALLLAAVPWVLWAWLRRRLEATTALLACLVFATSPLVLSQAGTVMTEGLYTGLVVALLFLVEKGRARHAGGLLLLITQVRPAGLSLLPGALAKPLRERDWTRVMRLAAPTAFGLAAWSLWSWSVSGEVQELEELRLSYRGHPWLHPAAVAADNLRFYLASWGGCSLPASWTAAAPPVGAFLAGVTLAGAWRRLRRGLWDPPVLMLAGGVLMHAFWAWQYERYLIPLLPWLLWLLSEGLGRFARPALALLLAGQVAFHAPRWTLGNPAFREPELKETYAWLATRLKPAEALASPLYVRDGFHAARPAAALPDAPDPETFARALRARNVRAVLWEERLDVGLSAEKTAAVRRLLDRARSHLERPDLFRLVYDNPREGARVYEPL